MDTPEKIGFDELFRELRKCHHHAVEANECRQKQTPDLSGVFLF